MARIILGKNYYIWGWSGQQNAGDDIFAYVAAWGLRRYGQADRLFMDAELSGRLSRLCGISIAQTNKRRMPGLTRLRRAWFRHQADCFVLAGGSLLPTLEGTKELLMDKHWGQAGRSKFALGLSVGPFQSRRHEETVAELLESMEYVAFRDDYSYDWAVSRQLRTNVVRAFDLAVLFPECLPPGKSTSSQDKVLGISLLAPNAQKNPSLLDMDTAFARKVGASVASLSRKHGIKVVFFSLCLNSYSDDRRMANAFAEVFQGTSLELFEHDGDPVRTFNKVRSCHQMVSMRLHGAIMAFASGVPFLQLEYHPKCRDFGTTIGLAESHRLDLNAFSAKLFASKLDDLLGVDSISSTMSLLRTQERAMLNFRPPPL